MLMMEAGIKLLSFIRIGVGIVWIELAAVDFYLARQQIVDHRRHERSAQEVTGEHGENDGHGQRSKQIFGGAADEKDGDEDDADAKGGDERRDGDLGSAVKNCLDEAFLLSEVAVNVF